MLQSNSVMLSRWEPRRWPVVRVRLCRQRINKAIHCYFLLARNQLIVKVVTVMAELMMVTKMVTTAVTVMKIMLMRIKKERITKVMMFPKTVMTFNINMNKSLKRNLTTMASETKPTKRVLVVVVMTTNSHITASTKKDC